MLELATAPRSGQPAAREDRWLVTLKPLPTAPLRMVCIPYAGGGAPMFKGWADFLQPEVEVCVAVLPGRGHRLNEEPVTDIDALTARLVASLGALDERQLALYGHSMGAVVAFEMARELRRRGAGEVDRLFVSGCAAPDRLPTRRLLYEAALNPGGFGGVRAPRSMLSDREFLLDVVLPPLLGDLAALERYQFVEEPPLKCGIVAHYGTVDMMATREAVVEWARHSSDEFALRRFEGDHFFPVAERDAVLRNIREELKR